MKKKIHKINKNNFQILYVIIFFKKYYLLVNYIFNSNFLTEFDEKPELNKFINLENSIE